MTHLLNDARYALRGAWKHPGFSIAALLTLAIGIGATTAVFSVVNAVLLRPLPFTEPDRIVRIEESHRANSQLNLTGATFADLRDRAQSFSHLAAFRWFPFNLADDNSPPESVRCLRVSEGFFGVLGAHPLHGRLLAAEDYIGEGSRAVVLSHGLWQRRFGGDAAAVGGTVKLDGLPFTVIGVLPPRFQFPDYAELWLPMTQQRALPANRRSHLFVTLGRLRPDVTQEQARSELAALAQQIGQDSGGVDEGMGLGATVLQERMIASVRPAMLAMLGGVGLLMLIACANVANLVLARGMGRRREMAIRAALGAGRGRLTGQLLTENLILGLSGGLLGLLLAYWGVEFLPALSPGSIPRLEDVTIDDRVLLFALLLSIATGVISGLWPAHKATRADLHGALREGRATGSRGGRLRLRSALMVVQVSLALMLAVGAGLLGRSFISLLRVDMGFKVGNVLTFFISPDNKYSTASQLTSYYDDLLARLKAQPGVRTAALANWIPTKGGPSTSFEVEGRPELRGESSLSADVICVSADYFRAMGIPLLDGRVLQDTDREGSPVAAVLSEAAARAFWPGENPIGKRLTMTNWDDPLPGEVVGVVGDINVRGPGDPVEAAVYFSYAQFARATLGVNFVLETAVDPLASVAAVQEGVWSVDKDQPLAEIATLSQLLSTSIAEERFRALLFAAFALIALLLVVVGVYGVVSYAVGERTREIGVRMALGAQRGDVLRMVLGQGLAVLLAGVALGLAGALALSRLLASLLFGIEPTDAVTFAGVALLVVVVALLGCYLPARRASRVDPMVALRYD